MHASILLLPNPNPGPSPNPYRANMLAIPIQLAPDKSSKHSYKRAIIQTRKEKHTCQNHSCATRNGLPHVLSPHNHLPNPNPSPSSPLSSLSIICLPRSALSLAVSRSTASESPNPITLRPILTPPEPERPISGASSAGLGDVEYGFARADGEGANGVAVGLKRRGGGSVLFWYVNIETFAHRR